MTPALHLLLLVSLQGLGAFGPSADAVDACEVDLGPMDVGRTEVDHDDTDPGPDAALAAPEDRHECAFAFAEETEDSEDERVDGGADSSGRPAFVTRSVALATTAVHADHGTDAVASHAARGPPTD